MDKFRVFLSDSDFDHEAVDLLRQRGLELVVQDHAVVPRQESLRLLRGVDAIFCSSAFSVDKELIDAAGPDLKVIATDSVGYNHIDLVTAKERGIRVGHTPDVVTDATAELTVGLLLATARRIVEGNRELMKGRWESDPIWLAGKSLKGATVGIFGLGRIGQAVMARLAPFGASKFLYNSRTPRPGVGGAEFVPFDELLRESDFLVVTAALTEDTKEIFDESAFARMKPDAIFVNTSRGGLVKQTALVGALSTGQIRAAGLDVMTPEPLPLDHPLRELSNCVLTPHIGTMLVEVERDMALLTARNIIAGLLDEEMPAPLLL